MKPCLILIAGLLLFAACERNGPNQVNSCPTGIQIKYGVHPCNGKIIRPWGNTIRYQNLNRNFIVTGPTSVYHVYSFDSAGVNYPIPSFRVHTNHSFTDSVVTVTALFGAPFTLNVPNPNPNRYDSCSATLYLHYFADATSEVCDTCFFN